jgi:hypothetical protein
MSATTPSQPWMTSGLSHKTCKEFIADRSDRW